MLDVPDAPARPIDSARALVRHILTVTLGLMLAIGLEKTVEWRQHVALRNEADANIIAELRDNRVEVESTLAKVGGERDSLIVLQKLLEARLRGEKVDQDISIGLSMGTPREASWQTANATGALGYMQYAHVKKYASAYTMQAQFVEVQRSTLSAFLRVYASAKLLGGDNGPDDLAKPRLEESRSLVGDALAHLLAIDQMGKEALAEYDRALK